MPTDLSDLIKISSTLLPPNSTHAKIPNYAFSLFRLHAFCDMLLTWSCQLENDPRFSKACHLKVVPTLTLSAWPFAWHLMSRCCVPPSCRNPPPNSPTLLPLLRKSLTLCLSGLPARAVTVQAVVRTKRRPTMPCDCAIFVFPASVNATALSAWRHSHFPPLHTNLPLPPQSPLRRLLNGLARGPAPNPLTPERLTLHEPAAGSMLAWLCTSKRAGFDSQRASRWRRTI